MIERDFDLLQFLRAYVRANGFAPHFSEMQAACGVSGRAALETALGNLEKLNLIRREARRERGIELIYTEDFHAPYCECDRCAKARYVKYLKPVQAIGVLAPVRVLRAKADNFVRIPDEKRAALLGVKPRRAAPRTRTAVPTVAQ